jgi:hypothetical protein
MLPRKLWPWLLAILIVAAGMAVAPTIYRTAVLGSGVLAQLLCSGTFVSQRDPSVVLAEDMAGPGYELLWFFNPQVDREAKRATASMYGLGRRTAVFREGLGCTLIVDSTERKLRAQADGVFANPHAPEPDALWPEGERVDLEKLPVDVDRAALKRG